MDDLTPPLLTALRDVRWQLLSGRSTKEAVRNYAFKHSDALASRIGQLWILKQQGTLNLAEINWPNFHQKTFWELLERGFEGQPIVEPLTHLEDEVESVAKHDLDQHLATLPFKALFPLLFLQFPAFVILLIGPLLRELV